MSLSKFTEEIHKLACLHDLADEKIAELSHISKKVFDEVLVSSELHRKIIWQVIDTTTQDSLEVLFWSRWPIRISWYDSSSVQDLWGKDCTIERVQSVLQLGCGTFHKWDRKTTFIQGRRESSVAQVQWNHRRISTRILQHAGWAAIRLIIRNILK